eukprot:TRINITY_DN103867_c0_g1_i1.p1 TRINITY_DN103867_c0_g1~~TRINITY_DN103867_c0_g1_i1.p1  ORF type:complete len:215 (-),score=14.84 TRINITY_DN103867_c0_g1_i1:48-692(-)
MEAPCCPICLLAVNENAAGCNEHQFHLACLTQCTSVDSRCPVCRRELGEEGYLHEGQRVYPPTRRRLGQHNVGARAVSERRAANGEAVAIMGQLAGQGHLHFVAIEARDSNGEEYVWESHALSSQPLKELARRWARKFGRSAELSNIELEDEMGRSISLETSPVALGWSPSDVPRRVVVQLRSNTYAYRGEARLLTDTVGSHRGYARDMRAATL